MSPAIDDRVPSTIDVSVKNWPDPPAKTGMIKNTTMRTLVLSASFDGVVAQISDYEPKRVRLLIMPIDAQVALLDHQPSDSSGSGISSAASKVEGAVLSVTTTPYEFLGPDALWLMRLNVDTRVTIIKEFG